MSWWPRAATRAQAFLTRLRRWLEGAPDQPRTYTRARRIFFRLLGIIFFIAFISLWTQIIGLVGSHGILPMARFLHAAREQLGPICYWVLPTLCWVDGSDAFLHAHCAAGVVLSVLLIADVAPALVLGLLWIDYLSLVTVCRDFLSFQWDNLLLEIGFLSIFLAPLRWRPRRGAEVPPSPAAVWLLNWLLFRLMFSSGVVKLVSGDPAWRNLTALAHHYETQPLPTWVAWYAHQLPLWVHRASCAAMFTIELAVPCLIFGRQRMRAIACAILVGFQLLIALTGNYGFFNWLTIALCLLLLEDRVWAGEWVRGLPGRSEGASGRRWPAWVMGPVVSVVVGVSALQLDQILSLRLPWPASVRFMERVLQPLRTTNTYGLFAVMTVERPELIIEGSRDGATWQAYEFRHKPGDVGRRPGFVAPHQPRLDWQLWFVALGNYPDQPWIIQFCRRLFEGSPDVLALLKTNPFPDAPPTYLRIVAYQYRFTDAAMRRATGAWWRREAEGLYCPVLTLKQ